MAAADKWAADNQRLLSRAFERFQENAEWPTLETLQLDFARGGQDIDVRTLAFEIPPPLGFVEQQRLILRARALQFLPGAAPLLATWFTSLQVANHRWLAEGEGALLTRADVLRAAQGDEHLALQVSKFLLRERWAFGDSRGLPENPDWSANVISEVRFVRDTRGPEELLAVRDTRDYPQVPAVQPPEDVSSSSQPDQNAWWRRLARWAIRHYWGGVATGITLLAAGAISAWAVSQFSGENDTGSRTSQEGGFPSNEDGATGTVQVPPGPGILEEAGEGGARTYRNPFTLSQTGDSISPFQQVRVECRVQAPTMPSVTPDGNWYRILSPPWKGQYYAPANSFWNGDVPGQLPYTHNTDFNVPPCHALTASAPNAGAG